MPRRNRVDVTEFELAVLEVLWDQGAATIRTITESVYGSHSPTRYATVQKLLERLEAKGCVRRDRSGFAHIFRAKIQRRRLIGQRLEEVAEKLCDGSLTPLLIQLAESARLSDEDRRTLRRLIDESG